MRRAARGLATALVAAALLWETSWLARPARADNDTSRLSKYGKAVFDALPADYALKANDVISYKNKLPANWLVLSPATDAPANGASTWGTWKMKMDHSAALPERVATLIGAGTQFIDILTLGGPDGPDGMFNLKLLEGLRGLGGKPNNVVVRILLGGVDGYDDETLFRVWRLLVNLDGIKDKIKVYVGVHQKSKVVWNHAKILAVDGKLVMTGGHNMVEEYLKNPTYHDLSAVFEGDAAHQAHLFANAMWNELCTPGADVDPLNAKAVYAAIVAKRAPPAKSGLVLTNFKAENEAKVKCPPAYALQAGGAVQEEVAMLAIGRPSPSKSQVLSNVRGKSPYAHPNDASLAALIETAESEVYISQKQLGPWLLEAEKFGSWKGLAKKVIADDNWEKKHRIVEALKDGNGHKKGERYDQKYYAIGGWPYNDHIARALLRGVKVHVVIGGDAKASWSLDETAQKIGERFKALYSATPAAFPKVVGGDLTAHLCKYLHIAPFARGAPEAFDIPNRMMGEYQRNHAKLVVVDKKAFYVGSQNLYHSPLAEFGYVVDHEGSTTKLLQGYWNPLWSYAKQQAVSGGHLSAATACVFRRAADLVARPAAAASCGLLATQAADPAGAENFLVCMERMSQAPHLAQGELGVDHNFGCALKETELKAWPARDWKGQNAFLRANIKLWKKASELTAKDKGRCTKLSPVGAFVKPADKGGVSEADLVVLTEDIPVTRAFAKDKFCWGEEAPSGKYGGWWTFTEPPANKDVYRKDVAVCGAWNDFSMKVTCKLKKGTVVAVGPTQSYKGCTHGAHACPTPKPAWDVDYPVPASKHHQVFLNTFKREQGELDQLLTECVETPWQ